MAPVAKQLASVLLTVLFLVPCAVRAEVKIALDNRVRNHPEERCGWCALETLARHHGLTALHDLAENHATRAMQEDLEAVLDEARVDYRIQPRGSRSTTILRYAIRENRGAIVAFRGRTPDQEPHMVTLVDFGPTEVRVIDPSDRDGRIRTMPLKRFLSWWNGFALVLEQHEEE